MSRGIVSGLSERSCGLARCRRRFTPKQPSHVFCADACRFTANRHRVAIETIQDWMTEPQVGVAALLATVDELLSEGQVTPRGAERLRDLTPGDDDRCV